MSGKQTQTAAEPARAETQPSGLAAVSVGAGRKATTMAVLTLAALVACIVAIPWARKFAVQPDLANTVFHACGVIGVVLGVYWISRRRFRAMVRRSEPSRTKRILALLSPLVMAPLFLYAASNTILFAAHSALQGQPEPAMLPVSVKTGNYRPWSDCRHYFRLARAGRFCVDAQTMARIQLGDLFEGKIRRSALGFSIESIEPSAWWRCAYALGKPVAGRCAKIAQ